MTAELTRETPVKVGNIWIDLGHETTQLKVNVPMVRLVTTENDVIPMVLLVNMHLIKGT